MKKLIPLSIIFSIFLISCGEGLTGPELTLSQRAGVYMSTDVNMLAVTTLEDISFSSSSSSEYFNLIMITVTTAGDISFASSTTESFSETFDPNSTDTTFTFITSEIIFTSPTTATHTFFGQLIPTYLVKL